MTMQIATWPNGNRIYLSLGKFCEVMTPASDQSLFFETDDLSILAPDGSLVASYDSDKTVRIRVVVASGGQWKPGAVRFVCQDLPQEPVLGYAWSPDGKWLAIQQPTSTSIYQTYGWDSRKGTRKAVYQQEQPLSVYHPMAFTPNSKRIAQATASGIALREIANGDLVRKIGSGTVESVSWDVEGNYLAIGKSDGKLEVYSMRKAHLLTEQVAHTAAISAVAWAPDGDRLVSGDAAGNIKVWKIGDGEWGLSFDRDLEALPDRIGAFAWSPDERQIVVIDGLKMDIFSL